MNPHHEHHNIFLSKLMLPLNLFILRITNQCRGPRQVDLSRHPAPSRYVYIYSSLSQPLPLSMLRSRLLQIGGYFFEVLHVVSQFHASKRIIFAYVCCGGCLERRRPQEIYLYIWFSASFVFGLNNNIILSVARL
jgi:hypothetical protein